MKKKLLFLGLLLVAVLTGCSHDESTEAVDRKQTSVSAEFVSADEAKAIASAIHFGPADGKTATTRSGTALDKEVQSVTPVPDENGTIVFYVINYRGGGFMLLSADKRVNPVLAVSETSSFPMNNGFYPQGLADWMDDTKEYVQDVRAKNEPLTEAMMAAWEPEAIQMIARGGPDLPSEIYPGEGGGGNSGGCKDQYQGVDQLLTTQWEQENGYNAFAPIVCDAYGSAPAGCVAVAVAQVMKYHRHPNLYNWNAMQDKKATTETAKLMKDVGDAVDMEYHCGYSSSDISKAVRGLSRLGYSARKADYDPEVVIRELKAKRPVILRGGREQGWFGKYVDGHEWVCDGWWDLVKYDKNCNPTYSKCFHMNWGWGELSFDGWYSYYDWRPGGSIHNYKKAMIYEIIPRR